MDLSTEKRVKILTLHQHTSKSHGEIAAIVEVCKSTVKNILRKYRKTGNLSTSRKGKCGRKPILTQSIKNELIQQNT